MKDKFARQDAGRARRSYGFTEWSAGGTARSPRSAPLIDRLAQNKDEELRRIILAFSQCERLFIHLGQRLTYACDPPWPYMWYGNPCAAPWMDALRALDIAGVSVRFSRRRDHGFVKHFRTPTSIRHQSGERRFRVPRLEGRAVTADIGALS